MHGERFESPEVAVETFRADLRLQPQNGKNASKIGSSLCKNVSILKANTSKNNIAIIITIKPFTEVLHVFFHILYRNFPSSLPFKIVLI